MTSKLKFLGLLVSVVLLSCTSETTDSSTTTSSSTSTSTTTSTSTSTSTTTSTPASTELATTEVEVFFTVGDGEDCAQVASFDRVIDGSSDPILGSLENLVSGPTPAEVDAGAVSLFSQESASIIDSVELVDGLLTVSFTDMRNLLGNASTSCGSAALLSQLTSTVFQFDEVERVRFEILGDCDAFHEWLQGECVELSRT